MYPAIHAALHPDKPAVIVAGTDSALSYAELEQRSTQLANAFSDAGLRDGDVVALLSTNAAEVFVVYWACLRSGLYLTPVNTHLSAQEVAYIVDDCGARALVVSADMAEAAMSARETSPALQIALALSGSKPR